MSVTESGKLEKSPGQVTGSSAKEPHGVRPPTNRPWTRANIGPIAGRCVALDFLCPIDYNRRQRTEAPFGCDSPRFVRPTAGAGSRPAAGGAFRFCAI